jgi:hypothetical protein
MNSICAIVERNLVDADDGIEWESPAGPADGGALPQPGLPDHVFMGPGDKHWIGQRCDVVGDPDGDPSTQLVRLTCGCRAHVPSASLQRG